MKRLRNALTIVSVLIVLLALVHWGGAARSGPLFIAGVGVLTSLIFAFTTLVWWVYGSPSPPVPIAPRSPVIRQAIASLITFSGLIFVSGGFWDQIWHNKFGNFGDDFLWPPHMLIYGSLALIAILAGGSLVITLRGNGDLRQRFRREPLIGMIGLIAAYLFASLPSDQIWHQIYGRDITPWSLPHIVTGSGFALLMLTAAALHESRESGQHWRTIPVLMSITAAAMIWIQIGTAEWERFVLSTATTPLRPVSAAFLSRPEWLYPVVVVSIALFFGSFALRLLRFPGAATLMALLVIGFRYLCLAAVRHDPAANGMNNIAHLLILLPAVPLDIWFAIRQGKNETLVTLIGGNLLTGAVFLLVGLPIISQTMTYPQINVATLPGMIGFGLLMALLAGWAGSYFGSWLSAIDHITVPNKYLGEGIAYVV